MGGTLRDNQWWLNMIGYSTHYRTRNCHRSPDTVRRDDAGSGDRRQVRRAARVRARWWGAGLQQAVAGGCTAGDAQLLCARGVTGAVEATGVARRGRNPSGCSTGDRRSGFPADRAAPAGIAAALAAGVGTTIGVGAAAHTAAVSSRRVGGWRGDAVAFRFQSPPVETGGVRFGPPGPVGPGCDDDAVEADQTQIVARAIDLGEAPGAPTLVACREEQREPHHRVASDLIEGVGGVPVAEIAPPSREPTSRPNRSSFIRRQ